MSWLQVWSDISVHAAGFFWKAGWAFVLGYAISGMIQAFVPKARLARRLGTASPASVCWATLFGAASSSCSFAALAAARSLVLKGAHLVAALAFLFASTNLVIELGVLIVIFLGGRFLAAELLGGLVLIATSTALFALVCPTAWQRAARAKVERESAPEPEDFDWRERIRSREGWQRVGRRFVGDWKMVWEEIVIGFTVAGILAALVPASVWEWVFLARESELPSWLVVLENAAVAPLVAAATFIGSMGNIPLATVLHSNGVAFAGVMGFIYSDLMVPPLVSIQAKYYGWRLALTMAGVMWVSIVVTTILLHGAFGALGITPDSGRTLDHVTRFALDYTAWLNFAMIGVTIVLIRAHRAHVASGRPEGAGHTHGSHGPGPKRWIVWGCLAIVLGGLVVRAFGF
ncbi:MAG: permease [bacterium]